MKDADSAPQKTPRNSDTKDSTTETLPSLADLEEATETIAEADPGDIIEQAEQLLRASAPHDYEVLIIGGGQAGCAAALRASQLGARVGLIEAGPLGGATPFQDAYFRILHAASRACHGMDALSSARQWHKEIRLEDIRASAEQIAVQESQLLQRTLDEHHVTVIPGSARFIGEHTVEVIGEGRTLQLNAVHLIIATGSFDIPLESPGAVTGPLTELGSISRLGALPDTCLIARKGEFGSTLLWEWASLLSMLGVQVTVSDESDRLLPHFAVTKDLERRFAERLNRNGLTMLFDTSIERIEPHGLGLKVHFRHGKTKQKHHTHTLETEAVLMLQGEPATADLGLEKAGVQTVNGFIKVDDGYNTNISGVYAVGDCTEACAGREQAVLHGIRAAESALERPFSRTIGSVALHCRSLPPLAIVGQVHGELVEVRRGRIELQGTFPATDAANIIEIVAERNSDRIVGCILHGDDAVRLAGEAELVLQNEMTCHTLTAAYPCHVERSVQHGLAIAAHEALRDGQEI